MHAERLICVFLSNTKSNIFKDDRKKSLHSWNFTLFERCERLIFCQIQFFLLYKHFFFLEILLRYFGQMEMSYACIDLFEQFLVDTRLFSSDNTRKKLSVLMLGFFEMFLGHTKQFFPTYFRIADYEIY